MLTKKTVLALSGLALTAIVVTSAGGPDIHSPAAAATERCKQVHANIDTLFTSATTTAGVITGDGLLNGTTSFHAISIIPGPKAGTLSYNGQFVITSKTGHGTLTLEDVGVFLPSPNEPFSEYEKVVSGTGRYAGATGTLFAFGTMKPDASGFTGFIRGELCISSP